MGERPPQPVRAIWLLAFGFVTVDFGFGQVDFQITCPDRLDLDIVEI